MFRSSRSAVQNAGPRLTLVLDDMTAIDIPNKFSEYLSSEFARVTPRLVAIAVMVALFVGWRWADEEYLTPKSGLGYWLGVAGGGMMLLLLVYSYRKRRPMARTIGSVPTWFRIHMLLGVMGPLLVVYHSNFHLGALNSNVALFTMLTVACSGVVGRYIYGKIHMGMHGRKAQAQEIYADIEKMRVDFGRDLADMKDMVAELNDFGRHVVATPPKNAFASLSRGAVMVVQSHFLHAQARAHFHAALLERAKAEHWTWTERRNRLKAIEGRLDAYFAAHLKAMELRFFERLFALWHVLHLPLFFLMLVAGFVHVWAVHRY
jgi:hypothetical protein